VDEASTLPYFLELLSVKDSGIDKISISAEAKKGRIIEALKEIVLKGSEIRPLILAYEDLHWMDKSSEEALKYGLESIPGARVLMIFTYRPEFVHTWGGKSFHSQITLNRLSNRESLIMISHILGTEDINSDLGELILEKTEGVPFFIEEFIESLKDLKIIERDDNKCYLAKDTQDVIIPSTIHDVIMARVDKLPEAAKAVLQTSSVVGREFSHDLIMRVTGLPEQKLLSQLSVLKDSELLYERGIYPQSSYIFKHALTQEVTYDSLLLKIRREVHEKIGRAIEKIYSERLEEFYEMLAYHYSRSENSEKAYQYLNLSGEKAIRNYSNWDAFRYYKEAIKVLSQLGEIEESKGEQIRIHLQISIPIARLGYPEDSLEILQEGERLAKDLGETKSLATFYSRLCHYYTIKGGDPVLGIEYGEKCFEEAERIQDIELMAPIACDLCPAYMVSGQFLKVIDMAPNVLALLEKTRRESDFFSTRYNVYSVLNTYCGMAFAVLGDPEEGKTLCEKGLPYSLEVNDLYGLGVLICFQSFISYFTGDGKRTIEQAQESIKYLQKGQGFLMLGLSWSFLGAGYLLLGEYETALKHIKNGLKIQKEQGVPFYVSMSYWLLSEVHFASNDLKKAQSCIEQALRLSQKCGEKFIEGISWAFLGKILGKRDIKQGFKAEEYILKGIKILEDLKVKTFYSQGYLFLGEFYVDTDQREKALENLNKAEEMFQKMEMDYWLAQNQEVLQRI
jgi:tetratricopeptide (TPR) repeat protein